MRPTRFATVVCFCALVCALVPAAQAFAPARPLGLDGKVILPADVQEPTVPSDDPAARQQAFARFAGAAGGSWSGTLHRATGRAALVSGSGLTIAADGTPGAALDLESLAGRVRQLIAAHPGLLAPPAGELVLSQRRSAVLDEGRIAFVDFDWQLFGRRVAGAQVLARINAGHVIQLGTRFLADEWDSPEPALDAGAAQARLAEYGGFDPETDRMVGDPDLFYLPVDGGAAGLRLRLVWEVAFRRAGEVATWTAQVDARDGTVLAFFDANRYGEVNGGIFPRTVTDPEQVVPFPFVQVDGAGVTNAAGRFAFTGGTVSTGLDGRYFSTHCTSCSSPAQASATTATGLGWLRLGTGGRDALGNGASTPAERNSFFHLNEARLVAKKWLSLPWFDTTVTSNVNIADTCNAFWDGTVNFYRSGGGCNNTGEIADVMQHEWGHGIDQNTLLGDSATGEGTGDHVAFLMTHGSVIGPYFRTSGGGVRDVDRLTSSRGLITRGNAASKCPASTGCGGPLNLECHCEGEIYGQAGWDLARSLVTKHGYHTGWLTYERMFFASLPQAGSYLPGQANTIYDAYLAVDDDDGNLANGTPNGREIYDAFNLHEIAGTARTSSAGCTRPAQPAPTASASCSGVTVSWPAASGATKYRLTKTRFSAERAFLPLADVTTTSYTDGEVRPGETYWYAVQALNAANCGSKIENVVSVAGPARPLLGIVAIATDDIPAGNRSGTVDPGESVDLFLTLENDSTTPGSGLTGQLATTAPGVTVTAGSRPFPDAVAHGTTVNAAGFRVAIGASVACGTAIPFTFTVTDASGCAVETQHFSLAVGTTADRRADTFDADGGWVHSPASTAPRGAWVRGVPDPTNYQAGADSSDAGTQCWFTATNPGGDGSDDVDDGEVILLSPVFDLSALGSATLSYQRWFTNRDLGEDAGDHFWVEASSNGGSTWVTVEKLGTNDSAPAWTAKAFDLDALIPLTTQVRFRVRVADGTATGNLIEGAFDDFRISESVCDLTPPCFIAPTFAGLQQANPGPDCAEASLAWNPGTTSCQNATIGYNVYRGNDASFLPSPANRIATRIPALSLLDEYLAPGADYFYLVRAEDSRSGEDPNLVRRQLVAPAAPDTKPPVFEGLAAVTAGAGCGETVLSWTAARETCSAPVVYDVFRSTSAGFTPSAANRIGRTTSTGLVDAALSPETTYHYIVRAVDQAGLSETNAVRKSAPATVLAEVLSTEDFEGGAAGWARSGVNDATTGLWELGDPAPTDAQPGTCPSGSSCWATGLAGPGLGDNDVDAGTTTLLSARFDLTGLVKPGVRYERYYSNNTGGAPNTDTWRVDVSNDDGATWNPVESTLLSDEGGVFRGIEFPLGALAATANMRVRFTASDLDTGSVVEAVLDDFSAVDLAGGCDGCGPAPVVTTIEVGRDAADVVVEWSADPVVAPRYKVYASALPDFGGAALLGTAGEKAFRHLGGTGDGAFTAYRVAAVDACGQEGPLM